MNTSAPWKVLHIELSAGIPTLPVEPKYQAIYAVFWWYGIPLGNQEILADQLPMPATQLANLVLQTIVPAVGDRCFAQGFKQSLPAIDPNHAQDMPVNFQALIALEKPLKQLQERCSQPVSGSVSVVVCTCNRPKELARCLRSLQNLSLPPQEIIVVDNAPNSDATRQLVTQTSGIKYVLEPRPGLSMARNTGICSSVGSIIAFTDDDVVVHPNWIAQLQQSFQDPKIMAVTGLMLPAELETEAQLIFHKGEGGPNWGYRAVTFDSQFFADTKSQGVPVWRIGAGANMAFRRKAFDLVGYFDQRLGAGASGCSEDSELWYRILAEGWLCRYEPSAVIYHYHRRDMDSLKHQSYQYMRGHTAALLVQFFNYKHWGNIYRLLLDLPIYYKNRLLKELRIGSKSRHSNVLAEIAGCLAGVKFYIDNRKVAAFPSFPSKSKHNQITNKVNRTYAKS
ncbi:glycosyltransferase family 2 protein [Nostoc sp. UHCC 0252]|uniref:glycosyltransferase family 2 protein n=1 Tax=Nostoc sp. UHCC 0252 TaxID=3110241 RepID=UPI002B21FD07|nr:glycosyltransferase [Nostoc sp. UHCC 0252]MEA5604521.1 glycosyltransferase [Nostoc sp. UHCC 0252]